MMKTFTFIGAVLVFSSFVVAIIASNPIKREELQDANLRVKRANNVNTKVRNITTIIHKKPDKQKDWKKEIHLTPLEIATVAAICLLIVGTLIYCVFQYIKFCCRNKNKIQRVNSSDSLNNSRNWKSVRRGSRDSDGRWSRSSNGSVDNFFGKGRSGWA